ncbi:hypothetical protein D3C78_1664190 [compost metagenome]
MGLDTIKETLHLDANDAGRRARLAGGRRGVPLHVENRRQGDGILWHVANEPVRLGIRCRAEIIEMIGRVQNIRSCRAAPMVAELRIDAVRSLCRLDEDEGNT